MNARRSRMLFVLALAAWSLTAAAEGPLQPIVGGGQELPSGPSNASSAPSTTGPAVTAETQGKPKFRQREGTKLADQLGKFERRGDRYVFLSVGATAHLEVLENLMLERVASILDETSGGALDWNVSGTLTEYRGSNYLLLTRANVKSSPGPNEPRRIDTPPGQTTALPAVKR